MVNVHAKKCNYDECITEPSFNNPGERKGLFCLLHKSKGMVNVNNTKCITLKCKNIALYGLSNKKATHCIAHKKECTDNVILESKCDILTCEKEFEFTINNIKYCPEHCPNKSYEEVLKKKCMYCDLTEKSKYICKDCEKIKNKKEWSIVRYLRKSIDTKFYYNTNKMLNGCSKKRPDIYFDLDKHCVVVEIDENQHKTYEDKCECARINEIVNGIGGKSVIIIRYNPDKIKNKKKEINIDRNVRLELLVKTIKDELVNDYDKFVVKTIQLFYDDNNKKYKQLKSEEITDLVCI